MLFDEFVRISITVSTYILIGSCLNYIPDLLVFIIWYYFMLIVTDRTLTKSFRSLTIVLSVYISVASIFSLNLNAADNDTIGGMQFLVLLLLMEISHRSILFHSKGLSEIIRVIIKSSILVLISIAFISCFCYLLFCFQIWVKEGTFDLWTHFVSGWNHPYGDRLDTFTKRYNQDLSIVQKSYFIGYQKTSLYYEKDIVYEDVKRFPIFKRLIKRYPGEGARLECTFPTDDLSLELFDTLSPFITKNHVSMRNSSRHIIQISKEKMLKKSFYKISLDIYALQEGDFGTYISGLRMMNYRGEKISLLSQSTYQLVDVIEVYACVFNVVSINEYYVYKHVPVGSLLLFRDLLVILVPSSNHVRVEHIVNDVQLNAIPGISSECCLPFIHFASKTWRGKRIHVPAMTLLKDIDLSSNSVDIFEVFAEVCVCPSLYGIHRIKLYHELYDSRKNKWITLEFWHPQITVVYPRSPFIPWENISAEESNIIEKSKKENDFSLFQGALFQYLKIARSREFAETIVLEYILMLGTAVVLFGLSLLCFACFLQFINAYRKFVIVKINTGFERADEYLGQQNLDLNTDNQVQTRDRYNAETNNYCYDAFISYAEDDKPFVMHILQPFFAQNDLRTFFGEDDLPSGPRIDNLQLVLQKSMIVLVVISDAYMTDNFYNYFYPNILLPLLHEGRMSCKMIVLLKYQPCRIPRTWLNHNKIVVVDCTDHMLHI